MMSSVLWQKIWDRDKGRCAWCSEEESPGNALTVRPVSMDYPVNWRNMEEYEVALTCHDCYLRFARWLLKQEDIKARRAIIEAGKIERRIEEWDAKHDEQDRKTKKDH